jgi:GTP cyclohydrolase I
LTDENRLPGFAAEHDGFSTRHRAIDGRLGAPRGAVPGLPSDGQPPSTLRRIASEEIDVGAAVAAVEALLRALGVDPREPGLADTPRRVASAYAEMVTPEPFLATTFPNDDGFDGLVVLRDIEFHSICMHHLLPFSGVAHVGYLPGQSVVGLSKLARVVDHFSRDLQIQERLTTQIADWLVAALEPRGAGVVLIAEHSCMALRGVGKPGVRTTTSAVRGALATDPHVRGEFMRTWGG